MPGRRDLVQARPARHDWQNMIGLITGSGFADLPALTDKNQRTVETDYGRVVATQARWNGEHDVVFLPRHGSDHSIAPHLINYRANIAALHSLGVRAVVATAVSGAIADGYQPGQLVMINDFLNFTTGRHDTFFDKPGSVRHTEMTTAYDPDLCAFVLAAAESVGVVLANGATYSTFNGPRFESPAEIQMAERAGADLVGMTGYPEVVLAREHGLAYCSIAVVSNHAAGKGPELSIPEIMAIIGDASPRVHAVLGAVVERYGAVAADPANAGLRMVSGDDGAMWDLANPANVPVSPSSERNTNE